MASSHGLHHSHNGFGFSPVTYSSTAPHQHQSHYFQGLLSSRNTDNKSKETLNWWSCRGLSGEHNLKVLRLGWIHLGWATPIMSYLSTQHHYFYIYFATLQMPERLLGPHGLAWEQKPVRTCAASYSETPYSAFTQSCVKDINYQVQNHNC